MSPVAATGGAGGSGDGVGGPGQMPAAEVDLTPSLVRSLLEEQHPDLLAGAPRPEVVQVANGWDNGVFRIGSSWSVRLPRRAMSAPLVEHELRWLPSLAPELPLPIPVPVRAGRPSDALGYPWAWSVCPWFEGERAAVVDPPLDEDERLLVADDLARFVAALSAIPAPADAPRNPYRGVPLLERDEVFRARVAQLSSLASFDARGWAVSHAVACLANSADEPVIAAVGAATLAAVLDDS